MPLRLEPVYDTAYEERGWALRFVHRERYSVWVYGKGEVAASPGLESALAAARLLCGAPPEKIEAWREWYSRLEGR